MSQETVFETVGLPAVNAVIEGYNASLIAVGPWQELGLSRTQAARGTVAALKDRGVLPFYTRVLAKQLEQRGFPADPLRRRLETQLEAELRQRT